jgi:transcriptional repressor NrdR
VEEAPLMVIKKDGRREPFDRNKLLAGIMKAFQKRPISAGALEEIASDVERELRAELDREVQSSAIGTAVLHRLLDLDKVAYVRFASVYKEFQDIETFIREIDELHNR